MSDLLKKQMSSSGNSSNSNMSISMGRPSAGHLGINRESRVIAKVQPKIRIIHIFAPEIINTDVENFRELVQRLTGKPSSTSSPAAGKNGSGGKSKGSKANIRKNMMMIKSNNNGDEYVGLDHQKQEPRMNMLLSEIRPMMMMTAKKDHHEDRHQQQHDSHDPDHRVENNWSNNMISTVGGGCSNQLWRATTVASAGGEDDHHRHGEGGSTTEFLNAFQDLDGFIQEFGGHDQFPNYVTSTDSIDPHLTTFGETHQFPFRG